MKYIKVMLLCISTFIYLNSFAQNADLAGRWVMESVQFTENDINTKQLTKTETITDENKLNIGVLKNTPIEILFTDIVFADNIFGLELRTSNGKIDMAYSYIDDFINFLEKNGENWDAVETYYFPAKTDRLVIKTKLFHKNDKNISVRTEIVCSYKKRSS